MAYVNGQPGAGGYPTCASEPDKAPGAFQWSLSCGNRACQSRGFISGLVQEFYLTSAYLTCF